LEAFKIKNYRIIYNNNYNYYFNEYNFFNHFNNNRD